MILHNMVKDKWDIYKNKEYWGEEDLKKEGFLHCSTLDTFWRVAPKLIRLDEEIVLIFIDESKLESELKFEDLKNKGIEFPHIYGPVNKNSIVSTALLLKDKFGNWIRGEEFKNIIDR